MEAGQGERAAKGQEGEEVEQVEQVEEESGGHSGAPLPEWKEEGWGVGRGDDRGNEAKGPEGGGRRLADRGAGGSDAGAETAIDAEDLSGDEGGGGTEEEGDGGGDLVGSGDAAHGVHGFAEGA